MKVKAGRGHRTGKRSSWEVEEQEEADTRDARSKIQEDGQQ